METEKDYKPEIIKTDEDLDKALVLIESLIDRQNNGELNLSSVIDPIASSIETYESKYQVETCSGVEMLEFLMKQNNHKPRDLQNITPPLELEKILSGVKDLDDSLIYALALKYHVSPVLFVK